MLPILTYAPGSWSNLTWAVVPASGGSEGSYGWLQLDTVSVVKVTDTIAGTECFEPGSFTVEESAPTPSPVPSPAPLAFLTAVGPTVEAAESLRHFARNGVMNQSGAFRQSYDVVC